MPIDLSPSCSPAPSRTPSPAPRCHNPVRAPSPDTYTTAGDLVAAARALHISPDAIEPFAHSSSKHQLFVARAPEGGRFFIKSYGTRARQAPGPTELRSLMHAAQRGTGVAPRVTPELLARGVCVTSERQGEPMTREAMQQAPQIRAVMQLLRLDHRVAGPSTREAPYDFVDGARGRMGNMRRAGIEGPIAARSLAARMAWIQNELAQRDLPQVRATSNVYPAGIWRLDDGRMVFTAHENDRLLPRLYPVCRLEYTARWPVQTTDEVALPAYLGRAPDADERATVRLIRAAINCDYYGYFCELAGPRSPQVAELMGRLDEDTQHIPGLPELQHNPAARPAPQA